MKELLSSLDPIGRSSVRAWHCQLIESTGFVWIQISLYNYTLATVECQETVVNNESLMSNKVTVAMKATSIIVSLLSASVQNFFVSKYILPQVWALKSQVPVPLVCVRYPAFISLG